MRRHKALLQLLQTLTDFHNIWHVVYSINAVYRPQYKQFFRIDHTENLVKEFLDNAARFLQRFLAPFSGGGSGRVSVGAGGVRDTALGEADRVGDYETRQCRGRRCLRLVLQQLTDVAVSPQIKQISKCIRMAL